MKKYVVVSCPIDTYSGYGARARDLVKALIKARPDFEVRILSQRWGNTRMGYLKDHNENDLQSRIIPNLTSKPDVWIQHTVPNEFQPVGKFNIGVTAGMETTLVHATWIQGMNRMDTNIVSSNHSKEVFLNSTFTEKDKQGQEIGKIKMEKPIEVLFEGVNLDVYKKVESKLDFSEMKDKFAFLFVGHWLQGEHGQDRKNVSYLIKTFLETFKNKMHKPALILKVQRANSSFIDQELMLKKIEEIKQTVKGALPNIYLLHGEMTDGEVNELYNHPKVKAMVSFTKGEGFGRPLLEFTTTGKPVIASGWSGHLDFLDSDKSFLVGGKLENVHPTAVIKDMILAESQWFQADDKQVAAAWTEIHKNYDKWLKKSIKQRDKTRKHYTLDNMSDKLKELLDAQDLPEMIDLKLPDLNLPTLG
jgi:glycosyltransferase involved in cell wall biosynthesis